MTSRITGLRGLHGMRDGVLERLDDTDLTFAPGGDNVSLGRMLHDLVALERSYAESLRDRVQRWPASEPADSASLTLTELGERFAALDDEIESAFTAASAADAHAPLTRPDGTVRTPDQQIEIYTQAMFIFLGKAVVYLHALGRTLPPSVAHYIG
jgi:uncharacterized damage-inducible protein DinB